MVDSATKVYELKYSLLYLIPLTGLQRTSYIDRLVWGNGS